MAVFDASCPGLVNCSPFMFEAQLTMQRVVHAWGKYACTFINHTRVRNTNLSSMISPGGVGFVSDTSGSAHPQHLSSSKLLSNSATSSSFASDYLIQSYSFAQGTVMLLRLCSLRENPAMCA